jgi:hypothetical protein
MSGLFHVFAFAALRRDAQVHPHLMPASAPR